MRQAAGAVNATGPQHCPCVRSCGCWLSTSPPTTYSMATRRCRARPYEPTDETAPQGVYARSKLAGEQAVLAAFPEAGRGTDRLGLHRGTGDCRHARRLAAGHGRRMWSTIRPGRRPTSPTFWPRRCWRWPTRACADVLHAANEGVVSRFGRPARCSNAVPTHSGCVRQQRQFPCPRRSSYSALPEWQWALAGLTPLRHWRSALATALAAPANLNFDRSTVTSTRD